MRRKKDVKRMERGKRERTYGDLAVDEHFKREQDRDLTIMEKEKEVCYNKAQVDGQKGLIKNSTGHAILCVGTPVEAH